MLKFNPKDNEMYQYDYMLGKGKFLLCSKGHNLSGYVVKAYADHSEASVYLMSVDQKGLEHPVYRRDQFVSIQWVNRQTFPEYFL